MRFLTFSSVRSCLHFFYDYNHLSLSLLTNTIKRVFFCERKITLKKRLHYYTRTKRRFTHMLTSLLGYATCFLIDSCYQTHRYPVRYYLPNGVCFVCVYAYVCMYICMYVLWSYPTRNGTRNTLFLPKCCTCTKRTNVMLGFNVVWVANALQTAQHTRVRSFPLLLPLSAVFVRFVHINRQKFLVLSIHFQRFALLFTLSCLCLFLSRSHTRSIPVCFLLVVNWKWKTNSHHIKATPTKQSNNPSCNCVGWCW